MALYTEKIRLYEKLRALFLFLSFLLWINESLWIHGQTFGSQSIKDLLALFCLAYSVGNNKMAFILFPFFKNHSLVYLHTIWMLALGHTFLAKSYVGRDSDETAFSKGTPELCSKEWEWVLELSAKWPNPVEHLCSLESSWGVCRPRQVGKICLFPLNSKSNSLVSILL